MGIRNFLSSPGDTDVEPREGTTGLDGGRVFVPALVAASPVHFFEAPTPIGVGGCPSANCKAQASPHSTSPPVHVCYVEEALGIFHNGPLPLSLQEP